MKVIAINLNEGNNKEYYWGKSKKYRKEWKTLLNEPSNHYDAVEFFKAHGSEPKGYEIVLEGEPTTIQEMLIQRLYGTAATYEHMSESFPEDFNEYRTSWDDLKDYADDMRYFINSLVSMI